jgi:hypothetical protein
MELLNQFSPAPLHITSSRLGPDILLSSLFSDTLNLCPSLDVSDSVSHPYNTTGEVETGSHSSEDDIVVLGFEAI